VRLNQPGIEHAVALFNESEAAHTVAGLSRTLGAPQVSVGAAAGSASAVRITVAWELCWYQWRVDIGEEMRAVTELAKGSELYQLDISARHWNGRAADGQLLLGMPSRRRAMPVSAR
jgi:hypothetical protein